MWPLAAYFALVLVLVTATLAVSYLLGPRHSEPATGDPYTRPLWHHTFFVFLPLYI
jgi:hypothetical protein